MVASVAGTPQSPSCAVWLTPLPQRVPLRDTGERHQFAAMLISALSLLALLSRGPQSPTQATTPVFPLASDTSFYQLARQLVLDSLWNGKPDPNSSMVATSQLTLAALRKLGLRVDSVAGTAPIMCSSGRGGPGRYVIAWNMVWGRDTTSRVIHLSAGCRSPTAADSLRVAGHSCGWEVARVGNRWRVVRSLRCWYT